MFWLICQRCFGGSFGLFLFLERIKDRSQAIPLPSLLLLPVGGWVVLWDFLGKVRCQA